jgi:hypothetical protein
MYTSLRGNSSFFLLEIYTASSLDPSSKELRKKLTLFVFLRQIGHAFATELMKSYNVPLLVLGGGGYTIRNVARAWTYETSIVCGKPLPEGTSFLNFFTRNNKGSPNDSQS